MPGLREALQNPAAGTNALIVDLVLHPFDGPFWRERSAKDSMARFPPTSALAGATTDYICRERSQHGKNGMVRKKW